VAAVMRCFREVLSRSTPWRSSRMTDTLRLVDHRPRRWSPTMQGHPQSPGLLRTPPASCFFGLDNSGPGGTSQVMRLGAQRSSSEQTLTVKSHLYSCLGPISPRGS
jgi:hypothetical protein